MTKSIIRWPINPRRKNVSLNIYLLESVLVGLIFVFSILSIIKTDLHILSFFVISLCIIFMGILSHKNPACGRNDIYKKASGSIVLAVLIQILAFLWLNLPPPSTIEDLLCIVAILGTIAFLYIILCHYEVLEFAIFCLCEFIADKISPQT